MTATPAPGPDTLAPAPDRPAPAERAVSEDRALGTFSTSIVISGIRCTLTYVVFPFLFPLLGLADGIGPTLGLIVGTVALASNVVSIRRLWAADHRYKWPVSALNAGIIVLLVILVIEDLQALFG